MFRFTRFPKLVNTFKNVCCVAFLLFMFSCSTWLLLLDRMPEILLYVGNSEEFGQFQMHSQQSSHITLSKPGMSKRETGNAL